MTDEMLTNERAKRILALCFQNEHLLPKVVQDEVIRFKNNEVLKSSKELFDLDFSARAYNILVAAKCKTIADLLDLGEDGLMRYRNCGRKTVDEIREVLMEEGFTLPKERHTRQYKETNETEDGEKGGGFVNGVHYTNPNFLLRCVGDSMYAMIRKVENEHRTQCTNLLDGHCNSKCQNYTKCWWRQLRSVADDYEMVRKGKLNNGEAK